MSNEVIQYAELDRKWLVYKYPNNEIKKGTSIIVRPGQEVVLCQDGMIADRFGTGRYTLDENTLPRLIALGGKFVFPKNAIATDIYFVNTTIFMNNGWGTKDPVICKDAKLGVVRLTAFGTFSFKIENAPKFIENVFGTRLLGSETSETIRYISTALSETIATVLGESEYSVLSMSQHYDELAEKMKKNSPRRMQDIGVTLTDVYVEHIGTTDQVNETIDDYSSMKLVQNEFDDFERFQNLKRAKEEVSRPGVATINIHENYGSTEAGRIVDKD